MQLTYPKLPSQAPSPPSLPLAPASHLHGHQFHPPRGCRHPPLLSHQCSAHNMWPDFLALIPHLPAAEASLRVSTHTGGGYAGSVGVQRWLCGLGGTHLLLLDLLLLRVPDVLQLLPGHALPAVTGHTGRPKGAGRLLSVLGEQVPVQQVGDLCQVVFLFLLLLLPPSFRQLYNLCREGPQSTEWLQSRPPIWAPAVDWGAQLSEHCWAVAELWIIAHNSVYSCGFLYQLVKARHCPTGLSLSSVSCGP